MHARPDPPPRAAGALELAVYRVVVAAGPWGVTAAEVAAEIDPVPAHSTAVTTLRRLHCRGVLGQRRDGRKVRYTTTADSGAVTATATAGRMHRLLAAAPDRDRVLAAFIAGLPPDETALLRRTAATAGWSGAGATTGGAGFFSDPTRAAASSGSHASR